jgi:hypothetical protein
MESNTVIPYHHILVLDQRNKLLDMILAANRQIDDKANTFLQAGGVVFAVVTAFGIADLAGFVGVPSSGSSVTSSQMGILAALFCFIGVIVSFKFTLSPKPYHLPGSIDKDVLESQYLSVSATDCYYAVFSDLIASIESVLAENGRKSRALAVMGVFLIAQVGFLALAIVLG